MGASSYLIQSLYASFQRLGGLTNDNNTMDNNARLLPLLLYRMGYEVSQEGAEPTPLAPPLLLPLFLPYSFPILSASFPLSSLRSLLRPCLLRFSLSSSLLSASPCSALLFLAWVLRGERGSFRLNKTSLFLRKT